MYIVQCTLYIEHYTLCMHYTLYNVHLVQLLNNDDDEYNGERYYRMCFK